MQAITCDKTETGCPSSRNSLSTWYYFTTTTGIHSPSRHYFLNPDVHDEWQTQKTNIKPQKCVWALNTPKENK